MEPIAIRKYLGWRRWTPVRITATRLSTVSNPGLNRALPVWELRADKSVYVCFIVVEP